MRLAVAALAAGVFAAGVHWGTFAVGGSDSYCYVHQAEAWAAGHLQVVEPLALEAPWPNAPLTFAPAGHIPSPTVRGAAVPVCPAGLSIVMAPFVWAGGASGAGEARGAGGARAVFLVVPLFGALLIWATYLLGSRFTPGTGLASAAVVACSPAFLFQLMQPMSDVPAAALWVLAAACATGSRRTAPLTAGLATSAAILVRPNLLPMGIVLGLFILFRPGGSRRDAVRAAAVFGAASAPGCLAVAVIQQVLYGSPLSSGYGSLDALFSTSHVVPNLTRYMTWMVQSHSVLWILGLVTPFITTSWLTALLWTLAVVNVACYLPYVVFDDWWYLRFMLPAIALLVVLTLASIFRLDLRIDRALEGRHRKWVGPAAAAIMCALFVNEARARNVFDLERLESRYVRAGAYVAGRLPPNALVITSWESGSVRFYGRRNTLVWDGLDPAWLDRAIGYVRMRGLEPFLLFERWEEPIFRQRFASSVIGQLDWPPAAEIGGLVRIYRPDDREKFLNGAAAPTDYAR
jgi:hypothetical protein